jgi:hypothetical protein
MKKFFLALLICAVVQPAFAGEQGKDPGKQPPPVEQQPPEQQEPPSQQQPPDQIGSPQQPPPPHISFYQTVVIPINYGAGYRGPYAFGYNPLFIRPGTRVVWVNYDNYPHTVTSYYGQFHGVLWPGWSFELVFWNYGDYPYYCAYHPNMWSRIQVVP